MTTKPLPSFVSTHTHIYFFIHFIRSAIKGRFVRNEFLTRNRLNSSPLCHWLFPFFFFNNPVACVPFNKLILSTSYRAFLFFHIVEEHVRSYLALTERSGISPHLVYVLYITHKSSPVLENGRPLSLAAIYVEDNSTFQLNLETFNDHSLSPIIS